MREVAFAEQMTEGEKTLKGFLSPSLAFFARQPPRQRGPIKSPTANRSWQRGRYAIEIQFGPLRLSLHLLRRVDLSLTAVDGADGVLLAAVDRPLQTLLAV